MLTTIIGSVVIFAWGVAHIVPTRSVVAGFGSLSDDNHRIITMEWVAEGMTLAFIGVLSLIVALQSDPGDPTANLVLRISAAMLVVMAGWSALTGARTSVLPMKLCPIVKLISAALIVWGTL